MEVLDVQPDGREGPRLGTRGPGGPWSATGQRRRDDPRLAPAAATRDEGNPAPVGRPARRVLAGRVIRDEGRPAAVDPDDPDRLLPHVRQAVPVRRPLRIADGVLGGRHLADQPGAQVQDEDLARPGGLGGVGDAPAVPGEARLARRVHGHDLLDRDAVAASGRGRHGRGSATRWASATAGRWRGGKERVAGRADVGGSGGSGGHVGGGGLRLVLRARRPAAPARGGRRRHGPGSLEGRLGAGQEGLIDLVTAGGAWHRGRYTTPRGAVSRSPWRRGGSTRTNVSRRPPRGCWRPTAGPSPMSALGGCGDGGLELVAELDGPPVGRPDRFGEDRPQAAGLQLVERRRARAAG